MFEGAASQFEKPDWYARFRDDFADVNEVKLKPAVFISDFVQSPGTLIEPTDVTQKVAADLERIKELPFSLPNLYEPLVHEEIIVEKKIRKLTSHIRLRNKVQAGFLAAAIASIIGGAYLFASGWHSNRVAQVQASRLTSQAAASSDPGSVPSAVRPTPAAVASYQVGPYQPRYVDIPKLNVHARVLSLGITKSGSLAAPGNIYDTGWYNQSAQPGQNGAMLMDGHISNWQARGVFYALNQLMAGDAITITRGDGQKFTYQVIKSQLFNADQVNMASLLVSANTGRPGLNLISCSGDVIPGTNEFDKRLVVYAVQI